MLSRQMWMVADRCNLSCTYCYFETGEYAYTPRQLLAVDYDRWLRSCANVQRIRSVSLTGGEPLLRDDILDLATVARRYADTVQIFTNAVKVTDEIAVALADLGCVADVSVDHVNLDLADQVRGGTKATLAGMERLHAAGVPLQIVMVVTSLNWREIETIARLARDRGWRLELLMVSVPDRHPLSISTLTSGEQDELVEMIERWAPVFHDRIYSERLRHFLVVNRLPRIRSCKTGQEGVFIDADGTVQVCAHRSGTALGNIREIEPSDLIVTKTAALAREPAGPCASAGCLSLT